MSKGFNKIVLIVLTLLVSTSLFAESSVGGTNARGLTGLIVTPSAHLGWDDSDFGLDFTYSLLTGNGTAHIPAVTISLFKKAEIALAYDFEEFDDNTGYGNILVGGKFQLYKEKGTALALGGNFESVTGPRYENIDSELRNSSDVYIVATYSGDFFDLPAVTSMMFGWQILAAGDVTSSFNYSMGFELGLFPDKLKNFVYWINDFSNYSYAVYQDKISENRGIFNTGLRIDPLKDNNLKLIINLIGTDLLDEGSRGFMVNTTFGFSL
ncbi:MULTISPECIES: hypothetical protein [unclassified Oceanispirochaeta]|uniref:hypothetical protein n=1 Tax=unclassified Oceanispirochaeta TaxID=2635722 RepID=UPI000E09AB28|nr:MULTISPECIES: hypothetical protein [unclassified Oceanispirochaeta]MBF9015687.1 hypothetical protein [Oceanispirochaeta sp. M2]NPD72152.1 hypothetical protein [Oceanispirochaeta sp. M1]RDG32251.1 hypothetical protein DV872_08555 [Oceanispirochaeta sp. M1]